MITPWNIPWGRQIAKGWLYWTACFLNELQVRVLRLLSTAFSLPALVMDGMNIYRLSLGNGTHSTYWLWCQSINIRAGGYSCMLKTLLSKRTKSLTRDFSAVSIVALKKSYISLSFFSSCQWGLWRNWDNNITYGNRLFNGERSSSTYVKQWWTLVYS